MEGLRLRVKDIDFARKEITVREAKGDWDRKTMLPSRDAPEILGVFCSETGDMADEPDVSADTISKLSPSKQIERNDGSEALEHALASRMRGM